MQTLPVCPWTESLRLWRGETTAQNVRAQSEESFPGGEGTAEKMGVLLVLKCILWKGRLRLLSCHRKQEMQDQEGSGDHRWLGINRGRRKM